MIRLEATVADTPQRRHRGLREREDLTDREGMLFLHEDDRIRTYTMRGVDMPLDIVFVSEDNTIREVRTAEPGEDVVVGRGRYVLEVRGGWCEDHGVSEGDTLDFDRNDDTAACTIQPSVDERYVMSRNTKQTIWEDAD